MRFDGSGRQKLNDDASWHLNVVGDWVYYINRSQNHEIYKVNLDGNNRQKLNNDKSWFINIVDSWIYFINRSDNDRVYRMSLGGSNRQRLNVDKSRSLNVEGGWVYYVNQSDDGKIFKMQLDGSERQKLNEDKRSTLINIADDWVYYYNFNDYGKTYRMHLDGSKKQKFQNSNKATSRIDMGNASVIQSQTRTGKSKMAMGASQCTPNKQMTPQSQALKKVGLVKIKTWDVRVVKFDHWTSNIFGDSPTISHAQIKKRFGKPNHSWQGWKSS